MKVALVRCLHAPSYEACLWREEDMAVAMALAWLQEEGIAAKVFDMWLDPGISWEDVLTYRPGLIAFSVRSLGDSRYQTRLAAENLIAEYRRLKLVRPHFCLFGDTGVDPTDELDRGIVDSVIFGEENVLPTLARVLDRHDPLQLVDGLIWGYSMGDQKKAIWNSPASIPEFATAPWPARYLLSRQSTPNDPAILRKVALESSRGCSSACTFCFLRGYDGKDMQARWRSRNPKTVVDEIERCVDDYDVRTFSFRDSNFIGPGTQGRRHAIEIAHEISRRNMDISFIIEVRAIDVDRDLLNAMIPAGLDTLFVGIESFDDRVLRRFQKPARSRDNIQACELCIEYGVPMQWGFIMFDQETTHDELAVNVATIRSIYQDAFHLLLNPERIVSSFLVPMGSTPARDRLRQSGRRVKRSMSDGPVIHQDPNDWYEFENRNVGVIASHAARLAGAASRNRAIIEPIMRRSNRENMSMLEARAFLWYERISRELFSSFASIVSGSLEGQSAQVREKCVADRVKSMNHSGAEFAGRLNAVGGRM